MIGMRVSQAKSLFFDRTAVMSRTTAAERKNLSKFGSFCRRDARSSIRKRKSSSAPGMPPSGHGDELLKKFIFFVYEPERKNVIIGPARLNKIGNAPEALEKGGPSMTMLAQRGQPRAPRLMNIRPRPYMLPAFERTKLRLPEIWRDSI